MNVASPIERQQAIDYIKARLARLSERKHELLRSYEGAEADAANQIKVIDGRVDHLLDALSSLQKRRAELLLDEPPVSSVPVHSALLPNNFEGVGAHGITGE